MSSSPLVNSLVKNRLCNTAPHVDEPPFQFIHTMDFSGVTLKTRLGVVQGHWKWRRPIDHMRLSIGRPFYLVPFSSFLTLNNIVTLKSGLEVTQGHWNWCHSKAYVRFPIRLP